MATIQEQNVEIEQRIFQPVQKLVTDSDRNFTEVSLRGKVPEHELGLINPDVEFLENISKYNGTLRMKQTLSNRYINDYSLYKVDYNAFTDKECPQSGLGNCNGVRFKDGDEVVIENSLRTPILSRDGDGKEYRVSNDKSNSVSSSRLTSGEFSFNEQDRTKKSCKNDDEKRWPDQFNISVPEVQDSVYLTNGLGVNTREQMRKYAGLGY